MKTIFSPANIEILLHCHVSPEPIPNLEAPAIAETVRDFISIGAIEPNRQEGDESPRRYKTTALGRAWVQALCSVPPPAVVFLDQTGKEIKI
jgi:hypothetical protein